MAKKEIWKDIKGYEGIYQISNRGRVKSFHNNRELIMKPSDNGNGYKLVGLKNKGHRKNKYIHRLVGETFIPNPNKYKYINHIDYNIENNIVTNLEWCTAKQNIHHSRKNMRVPKSNRPSKYGKGIRYRSGRFEVSLCHQHGGTFYNYEDAKARRDEIFEEYYG